MKLQRLRMKFRWISGASFTAPSPKMQSLATAAPAKCSRIWKHSAAIWSQAPPNLAFRETVEHASRQMWPPPTSRAKNSFWWLGSFAAAAVLLVLLSLIPAIRDGIAGLFGRHEEHIAVLPFENVGNNPANEGVSEGLMDSLSSRLTNLDVG